MPWGRQHGKALIERNPVDGSYAVVYFEQPVYLGDGTFRFFRLSASGVVEMDVAVLPRARPGRIQLDDLTWAGDHFVLGWTEHTETFPVYAFVANLDPAGALVGSPVELTVGSRSYGPSLLFADGSVFVTWIDAIDDASSRRVVRRFSPMLAASGPVIELASTGNTNRAHMAWTGSVLGVLFRNTQAHLALVAGGAVVTSVVVETGHPGLNLALSWNGEHFLACMEQTMLTTRHLPLRCRYIRADGLPLGAAEVDTGPSHTWKMRPDLRWTGCDFLLASVQDGPEAGPGTAHLTVLTPPSPAGADIPIGIPTGVDEYFGPPVVRMPIRLLPVSPSELREFLIHSASGYSDLRIHSRRIVCE